MKIFKLSTQQRKWIIIFNKIDIILKLNIEEVETKINDQKFYSKIDIKLNDKNNEENIISLIVHIPNNLYIRLESDNIEQIIELMGNKTFNK